MMRCWWERRSTNGSGTTTRPSGSDRSGSARPTSGCCTVAGARVPSLKPSGPGPTPRGQTAGPPGSCRTTTSAGGDRWGGRDDCSTRSVPGLHAAGPLLYRRQMGRAARACGHRGSADGGSAPYGDGMGRGHPQGMTAPAPASPRERPASVHPHHAPATLQRWSPIPVRCWRSGAVPWRPAAPARTCFTAGSTGWRHRMVNCCASAVGRRTSS